MQEQGTAPFVDVPADVLARISHKRRVPVVVTVNGHTFRTTIAPMGGMLCLGFNQGNAAGAGIAAGDRIDVVMALDTQPRTIDVPAELAAALDADPRAKAAFDALSYSHRREWADHVREAKKPETRERRAGKAVVALREG